MNLPRLVTQGELTRRALLQRGGLALAGAALLPLGPSTVAAQAPADNDDDAPRKAPAGPAAPLVRFNRFPRSVQDYYIRRVREVEQVANARRAALRTRAEAEAYVADVQARIKQCFGPFPEKTPLNPRITAVHPREGYRIENVIFESRPNFPVTANLYVPAGRSGPLPGVLGTCGHSNSGKAGGSYQPFAQALARQGYVTLIFDPIGQGERIQHLTTEGKARFGLGTSEHTYVGNHMRLVGEDLPTWFAWDGIRALDYLLSRPEVDPRQVGVTGNSGGGTQTTWLCGLDRRITMAAPSCFVTTLRRNIENEHSQDPEQFPSRLLAFGLDHSDFLAAMAPNPVMILGQEKDYFDARGFEEAADRLRHLYRLLGAEQNFQIFLGSDYHGFSKPNREAMYGWFNRQTGIAEGQTEPALVLEKPEVLRCTRGGQVAELSPATEFTLNSSIAKRLRASRRDRTGWELRKAITDTLRLPPREGVADYRILGPIGGPRGYPKRTYATYVLETEPGIPVVVYRLSDAPLLSRVPRGPRRAVVYIAHGSADAELRGETWLKELCQAEAKDTAIFACDVRGVGESQPSVLAVPANPAKGGADYFHAALGLLFDYSIPAQRTFDVLRVLDWVRAHGHAEVHLVGRGSGAIPATLAAVLHDGVTQVTLKQPLTSFGEIAEAEHYTWPLSSLVPGVLHAFDLPECYRELEKRQLRLLDPVGALGVSG